MNPNFSHLFDKSIFFLHRGNFDFPKIDQYLSSIRFYLSVMFTQLYYLIRSLGYLEEGLKTRIHQMITPNFCLNVRTLSQNNPTLRKIPLVKYLYKEVIDKTLIPF